MINAGSLHSLFTLSMRKRVFGGFAVVLVLLAALALVGLRGMQSVRLGAARVSQDSAQANVSTEVALQVADAHARVVQYALSATMDDQKVAQTSLSRLDQTVENSGAAGSNQGVDLRALATRYRGDVDATISVVEARRTAVEELQAATTEVKTIVSAMVLLLEHETDPVVISAGARVAEAFGTVEGAASRFVAVRTDDGANAAVAALQGLRDRLGSLSRTTTGNRRIERFLKGIETTLERFTKALHQVVTADGLLHRVTGEREAAAVAVLDAAGNQRSRAADSERAAIAAMLANVDAAYRWGLITSAGAIAMGLFLALVIGRSIARPVSSLTAVMRRLTDGALETAVPHSQRRDELGEMARAVGVFRDHMVKEAQLTAQQEEDRQRAAHDKHAALVGMAETIESETATALEQIDIRTAHMTATADEMHASAARTGSSAQSAATAARQAQATVQTVASAAEALEASIRDIGGQVSQSTAIVGRAVQAGEETRTTIEALNERVNRIGAVADLISEIAARTNLLALNATIEAARAGDAGKGFAVVASEVKQLAAQTAGSTKEITRHISEVNTATRASVAAVGRIEQTIGEVNVISGSIAASVEQQGAATEKIVRSVAETAAAADMMANRTGEVSNEAEQTGTHAREVHEDTTGLANAVSALRHSVIRVVRTATAEVDRRLATRYQMDASCLIELAGGRSQPGRVADMSEKGAWIRGGPALRPNDRGTLRPGGMDLALPFTVRSADGGDLHVAFDLDETRTAALRASLARVTQPRAA